jgi:SOS-response transcriptional repressor LexA
MNENNSEIVYKEFNEDDNLYYLYAINNKIEK